MNPLAQVLLTCGAMLPFNGGIPAIYFADKSILRKNAARQPLLHSPPWPSFLVIMSFASTLAYICSLGYQFYHLPNPEDARTMNVGACKCCRGIGTWYGWRIDIIAHSLAWALAIIRSSMWRARQKSRIVEALWHLRTSFSASVSCFLPRLPSQQWCGPELLGAILGSSQHDTVNLSCGDIRVHRGSLD